MFSKLQINVALPGVSKLTEDGAVVSLPLRNLNLDSEGHIKMSALMLLVEYTLQSYWQQYPQLRLLLKNVSVSLHEPIRFAVSARYEFPVGEEEKVEYFAFKNQREDLEFEVSLHAESGREVGRVQGVLEVTPKPLLDGSSARQFHNLRVAFRKKTK